MRYSQFAENTAKIRDPNKMLALRLWSDETIPVRLISKLGRLNLNNPADTAKLTQSWYEALESTLSNNYIINVRLQSEYPSIVKWLTDRYIQGNMNFEDALGQAVDYVTKWLAIKNQPSHVRHPTKSFNTDIFQFRTLDQLKLLVHDDHYKQILRDLINTAQIQKMKKEASVITLINNDRFNVTIPLNYGACFIFNHEHGVNANYCTGSSSTHWARTYLNQGPLIDILDKNNLESINGKWQIHAETNQIYNARQERHMIINSGTPTAVKSEVYFAHIFPGLLKEIGRAMLNKADEIKTVTKDLKIAAEGYDVEEEVKNLEVTFPTAWDA
jgi:hypothetical protein